MLHTAYHPPDKTFTVLEIICNKNKAFSAWRTHLRGCTLHNMQFHIMVCNGLQLHTKFCNSLQLHTKVCKLR